MSRLFLGGWCGCLGILVTVFASTPSLKAQSESSTEQLVNAVRLNKIGEFHINMKMVDSLTEGRCSAICAVKTD